MMVSKRNLIFQRLTLRLHMVQCCMFGLAITTGKLKSKQTDNYDYDYNREMMHGRVFAVVMH